MSYLDILFGNAPIAKGTCFFWLHEDRTFLVTNWHNLSGRNHMNMQPLHSQAAIPDRVRIWVYEKRISQNAPAIVYEYRPIDIQICENDHSNPIWFEHPTLGRKVDVAALDVTDILSQKIEIKHVNVIEDDAVLQAEISQDVFVIGFPFGRMTDAPVPVWKRGSIALDPSFDPDGLPKLLIDTATREGMSGSVVVSRHIVVDRSHPKKDGSLSEKWLFAEVNIVLGIYSGRQYPDYEKAQLGVVWRRRIIEETVATRKLTQYPGY